MKTWIIRQGASRATVQAPDYAAARERGAQIGFKAPDAIVLDDGITDETRRAEILAELRAEWRADDREVAELERAA